MSSLVLRNVKFTADRIPSVVVSQQPFVLFLDSMTPHFKRVLLELSSLMHSQQLGLQQF